MDLAETAVYCEAVSWAGAWGAKVRLGAGLKKRARVLRHYARELQLAFLKCGQARTILKADPSQKNRDSFNLCLYRLEAREQDVKRARLSWQDTKLGYDAEVAKLFRTLDDLSAEIKSGGGKLHRAVCEGGN